MNTIIEPFEIQVNVEQSAALLDEERPGWFNEINLDSLNMEYEAHCIAGQLELTGKNPDYLTDLDYDPGFDRIAYSFVRGFYLPYEFVVRGMEGRQRWNWLAGLWRTEIAERLAKNN